MRKQTNILSAPDYAKAFAITLVVLGHVFRGLMTSGVITANAFWVEVDRILYLPDSVGFFHMPLFFYVSGLFFMENVKRYGASGMIKRMGFALLCPLIAWSYIQSLLQYVFGAHTNVKLTFFDVLTAPFPPKQQFWFLGTLFLSVVAAAILASIRKKSTGVFWGIAVFCFCLRALCPQLFHEGLNSDFNPLIQALIFFPYFALGIVLGQSKLEKVEVASWICAGLFVAAVWINLQSFSNMVGVSVSCSIVCVLAVYKIFANLENKGERRSPVSKLFLFIGMNSMIIYLAHVICAGGIRAVLFKFGIVEVAPQIIGGVFGGLFLPLLLVPLGAFLSSRGMGVASRAILPVRLKRNKRSESRSA